MKLASLVGLEVAQQCEGAIREVLAPPLSRQNPYGAIAFPLWDTLLGELAITLDLSLQGELEAGALSGEGSG